MKQNNNLPSEALKKLYKQIGKIPLLTREEEIEIGNQILRGNVEAPTKLAQHNLRLVVRITKQIMRLNAVHNNLTEELIAAGCEGLLIASKRFNPSKGKGFAYYAGSWIKSAIFRELAFLHNNVDFAPNIRKLLPSYRKAVRDFQQNNDGRYPLVEETAKILKIKKEKVMELFECDWQDIRIDKTSNSNQDSEEDSGENSSIEFEQGLYDSQVVESPDEPVFMTEESARKILMALTPLEKRIIELHFGLIKENENKHGPYVDSDGKFHFGGYIMFSNKQLAKIFGYSRQGMDKLVNRTMETMKSILRDS